MQCQFHILTDLKRGVTLAALALVSCVLPGCGNDQLTTVPVTGRVVFENGEPVRTGTIEFESRDHGLTATGVIGQDGRFALGTYTADDGAVPGFHGVIVLQMVIDDGTVNHTANHGRPVDPKYASYHSSTLAATVLPKRSNDLTITVTPTPKKR